MTIQFKSGFLTELEIAKYFAKEGYEIYWPLLTQSRADFIAAKDKETKLIQCKKASWSKAGNFKYLQVRVSSRNKSPNPKYQLSDFDLMAVSDGEGRLWLIPIEDVVDKTSLCLSSTNPAYKPETAYDADSWRIH
jgi:hypothetical protein